MLNTVDQYNKLKESDKLLFGYKGFIDETLISNLMTIVENKLGMVEYNSRLKKKIFNILVEVVQNVYHSSEENTRVSQVLRNVYIHLVKRNDGYEVLSGNYIRNEQIDKLKDTIEEVNKMDENSLRESYRDRLDKGAISDNGRAGLGIMDMVRKSGNRLDYDFINFDKEFSLFSLKVNINNNQ
jgi:hypothetical protein